MPLQNNQCMTRRAASSVCARREAGNSLNPSVIRKVYSVMTFPSTILGTSEETDQTITDPVLEKHAHNIMPQRAELGA